MSDYQKDLEKYVDEAKAAKTSKIPTQPKKFIPKPDPILLKLYPDPHPLTCEEQIFFIKITEGTFGYNEQLRNEALTLLACDYSVALLTPYLCKFIREAIRVNIAFPDLSLLIYSVRMVKSLMANPYVNLKLYLHLLLPAVLSCVLSRKISKYPHDNHWTLRDFSAQTVATICLHYNNKTNEITRRVAKIYLRAVEDGRKPVTTLYGGVKGLGCLGEESVKNFVIPHILVVSWKIRNVLERAMFSNQTGLEAKQIKFLNDVILKVVGPVLFKYRNVDDRGVSYVKDFGYLGYALYSYVKNLERLEAERKNNFNVYLLCAQ